jgi:hypothetical protein
MSTYAKRIKTKTVIKITKTIKSGVKIKSRNELKEEDRVLEENDPNQCGSITGEFCVVIAIGRLYLWMTHRTRCLAAASGWFFTLCFLRFLQGLIDR